ncbi:uncharacterized protein DS421_10g311000 [Arachis hypogaea]|nr:uncharacterized protein DS421_10g311000 [Arachis hypogaea]
MCGSDRIGSDTKKCGYCIRSDPMRIVRIGSNFWPYPIRSDPWTPLVAKSNKDLFEQFDGLLFKGLRLQKVICSTELQRKQCFGRMYLVQDSRQQKNVLGSSRKLGQTGQSSNSNDVNVGNKKHAPMKKQTPVNIQPQDTSIERPIWEVTSEKFWHHPGIK